MAVRVLETHRRVVHEDADGERQAAQRHEVQRVAGGAEQHDGQQHGQRDRRHDDDGRAPAAEESEDQQAGQARRDQAFHDDAVDRVRDEHGLVEQEGELQPLRQLHAAEALADLTHDVERRGAAVLQHREQRGLAAVVPHEARLLVEAVTHRGDVADRDDLVADHADREVADLLDLLGAVVQPHDVFAAADLRGAGGQVDVLADQRVVDVLHGHAARLHLLGLGVDHDQARPAAVGQRHRGPRDRDHLVAHEPEPLVVELLFGQRVAAQRDLQDRHARRVVLHDLRGRLPRRHATDDRLRAARDLRHRLVDAHLRLEVDADDVLAVDRVRLDAPHIAHGRADLLLGEDRDLLLVGRRGHPHVLPDQRDDRLVDLGKDVLRERPDAGRPDDREHAREQDGEGEHHHRVGPCEREPDHPHRSSPTRARLSPCGRLLPEYYNIVTTLHPGSALRAAPVSGHDDMHGRTRGGTAAAPPAGSPGG